MKIARLNNQAEIFHSLQGEGVSLGVPAVFLRLAFCNLQCKWCDTAYTWRWRMADVASHSIQAEPKNVAEIIQTFPSKHLVITGGEPLLQTEKIIELLTLLPSYFVEIETNGTLCPTQELDEHVGQYNVSPKLKNSGNPVSKAINKEALTWFSASSKAWFKFVISNPQDIEEVVRWEKDYAIPHDRILLMPEGVTPAALNKAQEWLAKACLHYDYRLADRLHIHLWGGKPGC